MSQNRGPPSWIGFKGILLFEKPRDPFLGAQRALLRYPARVLAQLQLAPMQARRGRRPMKAHPGNINEAIMLIFINSWRNAYLQLEKGASETGRGTRGEIVLCVRSIASIASITLGCSNPASHAPASIARQPSIASPASPASSYRPASPASIIG